MEDPVQSGCGRQQEASSGWDILSSLEDIQLEGSSRQAAQWIWTSEDSSGLERQTWV